MHPILRTTLAVLGGIAVGSVVNMALVTLGPIAIPLPEGADMTSPERIRESMSMLSPQHFLFPFLAHALGTLAGAFTAARLAAHRPMAVALGIAAFFLLGGIAAAALIGGPVWFTVVDLVLAYLPMGVVGGVLARGGHRPTARATP